MGGSAPQNNATRPPSALSADRGRPSWSRGPILVGEGECYSTGPRGLGDLVVRWPAFRFVALGGTGEPERRPRVTTWSATHVRGDGGRGRRSSSDSSRDGVPGEGWLGREAAGYQVFVGRSPYRAGRLLLPPAAGADPAVAS